MDQEEVSPEPTFEELVTQRFELLDARIETQEQHMAELTVSYMELTAFAEALLTTLFESKDSPQAERYRQTQSKIKNTMFTWLENAAKQMGTGSDSLNEAVLRLVRDGDAAGGAATSDTDPGDGEASTASE